MTETNNNLDLSALADFDSAYTHDANPEWEGADSVTFRVNPKNVDKFKRLVVVELIIIEGQYSVASTSNLPGSEFVHEFAQAWSRIEKFVSMNGLTPYMG